MSLSNPIAPACQLLFVIAVPSAGVDTGQLERSIAATPETAFVLVPITDRASTARKVNLAIHKHSSQYVCVIEASGSFVDGAPAALLTRANERPEVGVWYADEAEVSDGRSSIVRRPIFSPERLRCQFYFGSIVVYRRDLFDSLGGLDENLPGAELYDLALRASRVTEVGHIDAVIFDHNIIAGGLDSVARESTARALESHLDATGGGVVVSIGADGVHDTRRVVEGDPLVSIVIPSRGVHSIVDGVETCYLVDAVRSLAANTTYLHYEVVVVLDAVAEPAVVEEIRSVLGSRLRVVEWTKPFNFSDKINVGVIESWGDFVLMLNDDVEVISPQWLESMLALAQRPGAGMVGAMLYYADDTIQHAGHAYYENDASHIGLDHERGEAGPLSGYRVEREVSGVTAACAMMPREVFFEVGGLSNLLPGAFNDVDLCMKTTWTGHSIYWTPHAELYHFESKTRDASVHAFEVDVVWGRWGSRLHDPRYWPYPHSRPPVGKRRDAW